MYCRQSSKAIRLIVYVLPGLTKTLLYVALNFQPRIKKTIHEYQFYVQQTTFVSPVRLEKLLMIYL